MKKKTFEWNKDTKLADIPSWLRKLMPDTTNLDALDEVDQFSHIRYRVQHEVDIHEEEGPQQTGMTQKEYRDAIRFLEATGGRLP